MTVTRPPPSPWFNHRELRLQVSMSNGCANAFQLSKQILVDALLVGDCGDV
jgi:hypothetical protein